ncbi:NAD-dependent epimerase/dehydratase family protein [Aliarcobacter butzleri]|uniref:NAD-dependent epimerase/dehydratase family protein n=1 Tax=Aliarcobacter butzleri TaxID=28197 RepID=UPI003AF56D7B
MNGKKVLITGGFGNLGSWIILHLASLNYDIYILTRKEKHRFENIKYKVIECDITNLDELKEKLNFDIDFCVHCASFNEFFLPNYPQKALLINTLGTRNILEALSEKKLKNFIYFSTFHVYGQNCGVITEESALNPKNDYASTHLFAEYYVKQFGFTHHLPYTILRLTNSYGAPTFKDSTKWYLVLNDLVKSAYQKKSIILNSNGKAKRDFIWMGDVCSVVEKLLIKGSNNIYNLSSGKAMNILELVSIVKEVFQERFRQEIELKVNENDRNDYKELQVDNSKLNSYLDIYFSCKMKAEVYKIIGLLDE